ncbi:MAG TPA: CPBP family intramembrane glutamic endopeptidase [Flavitalea sp.]|nr:CPBP family intramembrane glutamic endopeptidase [Flavitalea sp.]
MQHLERALDKQNQWWKYLVVFMCGFLVAGIIGAIPLIAVMAYHTGGDITTDVLANPVKYGASPNLGLFLMLVPFVVGLIMVARLFKSLHHRSLKETINGTNTIRWGRFFWGVLVWGSLMMICFLVDYAINPGNFTFSFDASSFIPLVLISVLIIPLQASFEEIMFRGYLAQGIAAWTRSRWVALVVPSLLFGLLHIGNPEIKEHGFWVAMPSYVLFGLAFGLIAILDDGIETVMGAHAINNIFGSVFITYKSSALATSALFYQIEVDPVRETLILIIVGAVFVAVLGHKYKWKYSILNRKVQ